MNKPMWNGYAYVAVPIDNATDDDHTNALNLMLALDIRNIPQYKPSSAWSIGDCRRDSLSEPLHSVNREAILGSSCVVAHVTGRSIGVPSELQIAKDNGIPTVVFSDSGLLSRSFSIHDLATAGIYTDCESAAEKVIQILERAQRKGTNRGFVYIERDDNAKKFPLPAQMHHGDAGMDIYVSEDTTVQAGAIELVPAGLRIEPPNDMWFLITGRSSTFLKRGLQVQTSIIDSGFRGKLFAIVRNVTDSPVSISAGDRIAQLIPFPVIKLTSIEVDSVGDSQRGNNGFGSTGA